MICTHTRVNYKIVVFHIAGINDITGILTESVGVSVNIPTLLTKQTTTTRLKVGYNSHIAALIKYTLRPTEIVGVTLQETKDPAGIPLWNKDTYKPPRVKEWTTRVQAIIILN